MKQEIVFDLKQQQILPEINSALKNMNTEQAKSLINEEMHVVMTELTFKTNDLINELKEKRRYDKIVF